MSSTHLSLSFSRYVLFSLDSGSYVPSAWEKNKVVLNGSLAPLLIKNLWRECGSPESSNVVFRELQKTRRLKNGRVSLLYTAHQSHM